MEDSFILRLAQLLGTPLAFTLWLARQLEENHVFSLDFSVGLARFIEDEGAFLEWQTDFKKFWIYAGVQTCTFEVTWLAFAADSASYKLDWSALKVLIGYCMEFPKSRIKNAKVRYQPTAE